MSVTDCYNIEDFKRLAKKKLPAPIFHYIDGGADDETTLKRNTDSFSKCDLITNIAEDIIYMADGEIIRHQAPETVELND